MNYENQVVGYNYTLSQIVTSVFIEIHQISSLSFTPTVLVF